MNDSDDADDDFLPSAQPSFYAAYGRSQNHGASTSGSQIHGASIRQNQNTASISQKAAVSASQRSRNEGSSSQKPRSRAPSQKNHDVPANSDRERQLVHLTQGLNFLTEQIKTFAQTEQRSDKKEDKKKKPKDKEHKCHLCHRVLANSTNLFRHYRGIHGEFNPERFGYTVNNTILSIDDFMTQEHRCGICGYVTADKNALDAHTAVVHSNDVRECCKVCGYRARSKDDLDSHSRIHGDNESGNNNNVVDTIKDKMHKCHDCSCYFDDKSKFDEHMKAMHGFEFLCRICNKNLRFKDFKNHVRDNHPDVYIDKDEHVEKTNVVVEKNVRAKKGKRIVFKCSKCTDKFSDKKEAQRHVKMHKKKQRSETVSSGQTGSRSGNCEDINTNNEDGDILYICEHCNIATASYDVVVEHSQKHITNPNIRFLSNNCDVCCLNFEPICYEKHINVHYRNKAANKDSFKCLKYKCQLLLTDDWLKFFNMPDEVVKRILSRSIYTETRSIKMRVMSGESNTNTLYQCSQCDHFVEPSAVRVHALNYDTCLKIHNTFTCNVCKRCFNTENACETHEGLHNDTNNESFRTVMFNNERDKEFNHILNNTAPTPERVVAATNEENNGSEKVIYKCLCGLCFVSIESANHHSKVCPGREQKQTCQKCNNLFTLHELVIHCYEHHLEENIRLIIKDIVPDVISVSDDESMSNEDRIDAIEIPSSDDEGDQASKNNKAIESHGAGDNLVDKEHEPQTSVTGNVTQANAPVEESNIQTNLVLATDTVTVRDDVPMEEDDQDESNNDENSDHLDIDVIHDDDSQDTITGEFYDDPSISDVAIKSEIKCVETELLMNPFFIRNRSMTTGIGTKRLKISAPDALNVKEEIPWYVDETNAWTIVQQKKSNVTSTDTVIDLDEILTDDEDEVTVVRRSDAQENRNHFYANSLLALTERENNFTKNITENSDSNIANNIQNGMITNSNIASNVSEYFNNVDDEDAMDIDISRPNAIHSMNVIGNGKSREATVLAEKRTIINTDNIKIEDETRMKIKLVKSVENENVRDDVKIEEILRPNDDIAPFRNGVNDLEKRVVVNNLEIQLSGQDITMNMKPNCNIV